MQIRAHDLRVVETGHETEIKKVVYKIPIEIIERYLPDWIIDAECEMQSASEIATKRNAIEKFLWWMRRSSRREIGENDGKAFLAYMINAHETEKGRWGNKKLTTAPSRRTIRGYFLKVRLYFNWLLSQQLIESNPFADIKLPKPSKPDIRPFSVEQVQDLLAAAGTTDFPARDRAIVSLMIDTGIRASELCGIHKRDLDLHTNHGYLTVVGKGGKVRTLAFQRGTARLLWEYEQVHPVIPDSPYFTGKGGGRRERGYPLTRHGLLQLFERLGKRAGIVGVRCSPHTCRHTFAITFLRNGGNAFTLKAMLGHESLYITDRYVQIADADVESQHRAFSPMDSILGLKRKPN